MGKVSRADWAASVPWEGIIGKPVEFGVTDIGELTGDGYSNGQYPSYDAATGRFRPATLPSPSPTPTPTPTPANELWVNWTDETLHCFQSAQQDFDFIGAIPSMAVAVGTPFDLDYLQVSAYVPELNVVRVTVLNTQMDDITLGSGVLRLRLFST